MSSLYMPSRIIPENQQSFYLIFFLRSITKLNFNPVSLNFLGRKARFSIYRGNKLLNALKDVVDLNFDDSQCRPKKVELPFMLKTSGSTQNVNLSIKIDQIEQGYEQHIGEISLDSNQYINQFSTNGTDHIEEEKTLQRGLNFKYTIFIGRSLRDVQNVSKDYKRLNGYMILSPNRSRQSLIMEGEQRSSRGSSRSNFFSGKSQVIDIGSRIRDWSQRRHSKEKDYLERGDSRVRLRQKEEQKLSRNESKEKCEDNTEKEVQWNKSQVRLNIKIQQPRDNEAIAKTEKGEQENREQAKLSKNQQTEQKQGVYNKQRANNENGDINPSSEEQVIDIQHINCKREYQKVHIQANQISEGDQKYEVQQAPLRYEQNQGIAGMNRNINQQIASTEDQQPKQRQSLVEETPLLSNNLEISSNNQEEVRERENTQNREQQSIVIQKTNSSESNMEKSMYKTGSDWKLTFKILILFIILGFSLVYFGPLAIDENFDEYHQLNQRSDKKAKRKGGEKSRKKSTTKNDIQ